MLTVEQAFENFCIDFSQPNDKERLIHIVKFYCSTVIDECTNKAMILEDFGDDHDYKTEMGETSSSHSGGYIRNEHYVTVDRESIQKVKELL